MSTQPTVATASTAPVAGQLAPTPTASDPIPYAYSTGNAFAAFEKFNGKNYFAWRRKMETQLVASKLRFVGSHQLWGLQHLPVLVQ